MSALWRKRQRVNRTASVTHSGRFCAHLHLSFQHFAAFLRQTGWQSGCSSKERQPINVARRQIAPSSVRIDDWEEECREKRRVCFDFFRRRFCPRDKSRRSGLSAAEGYKGEVRNSPGPISGARNRFLLSLVLSLLFSGTSAIAASRAASQRVQAPRRA